jgi:hypothetical protein
MKHLTDNQLTLLYYNEASTDEHSHAASCEACRLRFADFAQFMDAMRDVPAASPRPQWEKRLWSEIEPRVAEALMPRRPLWARLYVMGPALAAVCAAVFFAGMYTQNRFDRSHPESFSPKSRERVLLITMGDHLDRSQIVLAELANAPESGKTDISSEQQLAARLLGENRLLRQTAQHVGDASDAALLDQLERVLLDIAHSPAEVSSSELKDLQDRIEAQGLLFKVRVVSAADRQKGMKL